MTTRGDNHFTSSDVCHDKRCNSAATSGGRELRSGGRAMASYLHLERRTRDDALAARRDDWLRDGILSGFVATFAMTVVLTGAYLLARGIGEAGGNTIQRWLWALTDNPVTETSLDAVWVAIA